MTRSRFLYDSQATVSMIVLLVFFLFGLHCEDFTSGQKCEDIDTTACLLLQRSKPNLCTDVSVAQSTCPRFCGLCPLTCYNCQSPMLHPTNCNQTTVCGDNETCLLKELKASNGHHMYIMMCEKQEVCDGLGFGFQTFGKRDSEISLQSRDISFTCCKRDLCNMPVMSTTPPSTTTTNGLSLWMTTDHHGISNVTVHSGGGHCPGDILLIVDDSGSVGLQNFQLVKNFIVSVINGLNIGVSENHISMITFSTNTHLEWNLNRYDDKNALINAILNVKYASGTTRTAEALQYARTHVFTPAAGDRQDFPNVAIVLTDGQSINPLQTVHEAAALQHVAKVVAIGIGPSINTNELYAIATDPDQQNVFLVKDFHELQNLLTNIGSVAC